MYDVRVSVSAPKEINTTELMGGGACLREVFWERRATQQIIGVGQGKRPTP